MGRITFGGF